MDLYRQWHAQIKDWLGSKLELAPEDYQRVYERTGKRIEPGADKRMTEVLSSLIPSTPEEALMDFFAPTPAVTFNQVLPHIWQDAIKPLTERHMWYAGPATRRFIDPKGGMREIVKKFTRHPLVESSSLKILEDPWLVHPDSQSLIDLSQMHGRGVFGWLSDFFDPSIKVAPGLTIREAKAAMKRGVPPDPRLFITGRSSEPVGALMEAMGEASMGSKWHALKGELAEPTSRGWWPAQVVYGIPDYFSLPFKYIYDPKQLKKRRVGWRRPWQKWYDLGLEQATRLQEGRSIISDDEMVDRIFDLLNYQKKYMQKHLPGMWEGMR